MYNYKFSFKTKFIVFLKGWRLLSDRSLIIIIYRLLIFRFAGHPDRYFWYSMKSTKLRLYVTGECQW
jgi:hypothetical protein